MQCFLWGLGFDAGSGTCEFPGDHGEEETPVPIPNTAVKLLSGDGTVGKATEE